MLIIGGILKISFYRQTLRSLLRCFSSSCKSSQKLITMTKPSIASIMDNIIKSEEDKRLYRGLELTNGMKVILISDETTDKSAAALDVHIGYMSDPRELPGLAHFCEHMLFLGTEKYPTENEYSKFLSEHSGCSNAFTTSEHTNYYFDVSPQHLEGALDRFAQFFLCPLFTESATDREVNAVNSENDKNLQNDHWRLYQLERSTANPKHDFSKFGTGNKETLDIKPKLKSLDVRQELLKFHSKFYSSNIMAFAVLGKESLDELMEMVLDLFSNVQNKDIIIPEWLEHPFGPEQLKLRAFVVPVKDIRNMSITFPIPDLHPWYTSNPGHFLGHLIGHEGPGSLLSELKAKGWVNALVGGQKSGAKGFMFFIVNVDLTEQGIEHTEDIATLIFQYLNMLKKEGPQEWVFKECQDLNAMTFRFKDKEKPESYVCSLAGYLHEYPMKEVLSGPYLMQEFRPDLINLVLNQLEPDNVRVAIIAKKFESVAVKKEEWYGTSFGIEPLPNELLQRWQNAGFNPNLKLPPRNEFIPTNFDLVPREEETSSLPILLQDTSLSRVWFKQDDKFLLPKVSLNFEFYSPLAYLDPVHCNLEHMFVQLFRDALTEYAYSAELAGLNYSLDNTKYGMFLNINGYNDKLHVLLQKIMDKMTSFQIDPKRFDILKEAYVRALRNFHAEQPHQHAIYYTSVLMAEHAWIKEELLEAIEDVTIERLEGFIPQLLTKMYIESLLHGNITRQKSLELQGIVEDSLKKTMKTKPLLPSQLIKDREIQLPDGCFYIYRQNNEIHRSSSIEIYYQCCLQETYMNTVLELFCQLINEPCFNILRTKEQLGYIVFSGVRRSSGVQGLYIIVQSDKSPRFLDARIEAFLFSMEAHIQEMSDECFKKHVAALVARRLEKPKKLGHQTALYWSEITSQQYNFDRDNIEVAQLKLLSKDDVLKFYKNLLSCDAPKRHKLSVHILSTAPGGAGSLLENQDDLQQELDGMNKVPESEQVVVIDNLTQFKSGLGLFPLVKPYINLPVAGTKSKL